MKTTLKYVKRLYGNIIHSIAFFPVLISVVFLVISLAVLSFETREFANWLKESIPSFYIQHTDTARTLLATVFGGILTLTVFSFSMVMLVLNQASSSYSPRLLPGLISDKKHQIILGIYTGTLLYCLLILTSLGSYNSAEDSIGFAAMLGSIFGILCVALFVFFIHRISIVIQIDHIIKEISTRSSNYLHKKLTNEKEIQPIENNWKTIYSSNTGYYDVFDIDLLPASLKNIKNTIEIVPYQDQHLWKGDPLFKVSKSLSEEQLEQLELSIILNENRHSGHSYAGGMIKLMEIAVKALSPGINDPGTAIDVITRLTPLLVLTLSVPSQTECEENNSELLLIQNNIGAEQLMQLIVQPIRFYARMDVSVTSEMVRALKYIKNSTQNKKVVVAVENQLKLILEDLPTTHLHKIDQGIISSLINA